jgi:hypothetical protein
MKLITRAESEYKYCLRLTYNPFPNLTLAYIYFVRNFLKTILKLIDSLMLSLYNRNIYYLNFKVVFMALREPAITEYQLTP